jgi:hypothetical protein
MGHRESGMGYGETKEKKDNFFLLPISNAQCPLPQLIPLKIAALHNWQR